MGRIRVLHLACLLAAVFLSSVDAGAGAPPDSTGGDAVALSDLAAKFGDAVVRAAGRHGVTIGERSLSASGNLRGSAALEILGDQLDRRLSPVLGTSKNAAALPAVLEVRRDRLVLSAPLLDARGSALDAIAASIPLSPAVEHLLDYGPLQAAGFTLQRLGSLPEVVLDAASGDLDDDGTTEVAVLTDGDLMLFALRDGRLDSRERIRLPDEKPETPVRDPRGVVALAEATRGWPGRVYVRQADRARTSVLAFKGGKLVSVGSRKDVLMCGRVADHARRLCAGTFEPGTNWLRPQLRLELQSTRKTTLARQLRPYYVVRSVYGSGDPSFALLDTDHTLRLYDAGLEREAGRVAACGGGFAVADFLGDGTPEALCSGTDLPSTPDRVRLIDPASARTLWTSPTLPGGVRAIAVIPGRQGVGALLFVDDGTGAGTTIWWLRRGY